MKTVEANASTRKRKRLGLMMGLSVGIATAFASTGSYATHNHQTTPASAGTYEKGELEIPLHRGGAIPFELTVLKTKDCDGEVKLDIKWDEEENWVKVHATGKRVLDRFPDVDRTEGVNFFPNAFLPEPEDIEDGYYQLWLVASGPMLDFYFDPVTLDLMGSSWDFETPPSPIVVPFPTLKMFPTPKFQPKANGDVDLEWTFPFDHVRRGDRPELGHHLFTFPPTNLCGVNPYRVDLSELRPYMTPPSTVADAPPFSDYVRSGMLFDITVEPAVAFTEPPLQTLIGSFSNTTLVGGVVPKGWSLDIDAAFASVAPPIRPWPGAGQCADYFQPVHTKGINFCPPPSP